MTEEEEYKKAKEIVERIEREGINSWATSFGYNLNIATLNRLGPKLGYEIYVDIRERKEMKELDLHGLYHHQVRDEVENFVLVNAKELPLRIITGGSTFMKNLTQNILDKHKFEYHTPAHNAGEIIVTFDKEYKI